jgi:MoaA/NifB/PqqE/SkfB family radical SAM enzyme
VNLLELKTYLSKKYDLVFFEDLADYRSKHRSIFDLFKIHRKDEFAGDQRLVFYSSFEPEQSFIDHIQYAAHRVDVSNFFILIVTPFDIVQKLSIASESIGYDFPMQSTQLPISETKTFPDPKFVADRSSICALPFLELQHYPDAVVPCCIIQKNFKHSDQTLTDIFYGPELEKLRHDLKTGRKPEECRVCWDNENKSITSVRNHGNAKNMDRLDYELFDDPKILNFSILGNNTCNFACRICQPRSSSKISLEALKSTLDKQKRQEIEFFLNEENYKDQHLQVFELLDELQHLHIFGGEPLLWKKLPWMLEEIISRDRARVIHLELTTNCSIDPSFLTKLLSQFKSVEILLSIDDIGPRFEIQRGSTWNTIIKNIEIYKSMSDVKIKLSPTVNIQNLLYLDELVSFANESQLDIVWNYLTTPIEFNIDYITDETKRLALEKYFDHPEPELRAIAYRLQQTKSVSGEKFIEAVNRYDSLRNQNFKQHHAELVTAMSKWA